MFKKLRKDIRKNVFPVWTRSAVFYVLLALILAHSCNGFKIIQSGNPEGRKLFGGYRITPKICRATKTLPKSDPRANGPTICMFNHECAQRNGEVVGACMDGFLFGACCQVPGGLDTTLIKDVQSPFFQSNQAAAASYEQYGGSVSGEYDYRPPAPPNNFYENNDQELESDATDHQVLVSHTNTITEDHKTNTFYVENESVVVSSPSSPHLESVGSIASTTGRPTIIKLAAEGITYTTELPSKFASQLPLDSFEVIEEEASSTTLPILLTEEHNQKVNYSNGELTFGNGEFTHSDITHPAAESELLENDLQFSTGYGPQPAFAPVPAPAHKPTFSKPVFRPKPANNFQTSTTKQPPSSDEGYVLVQTITNSPVRKPISDSTLSSITTNIDSIESIILMLNESNHGPSYDIHNSSNSYGSSSLYATTHTTQRPLSSTNSIDQNSYGSNSIFISTVAPDTVNIHADHPSEKPLVPTHIVTNFASSTYPSTTLQPPSYQSQDSYGGISSTSASFETVPSSSVTIPTVASTYLTSTSHPLQIVVTSSTTARPNPPKRPATTISIRKPSKRPSKRPTSQATSSGSTNPSQLGVKNEIPVAPTKLAVTKRPPSTSYVTGPTPPRPIITSYPHRESTTTKIDPVEFASTTVAPPQSSSYASSTQTFESQPSADSYITPIYVKIQQPTQKPPAPTVLITPKPTVNLVTSSWAQRPSPLPAKLGPTTPAPSFASTSYIFSPLVTRRPEVSSSTEYLSVPHVTSNDFDDPGYYGVQTASSRPQPSAGYTQVTTETLHAVSPSDDRPAFPGYYGPTPSYPLFHVPTEVAVKNENEEETYTSPNDFVNFPPVRNPNLNMSASSSSVTNDFDTATPPLVEDTILKNKMDTLVHKIVESLQDNFEALADLIEEGNTTVPSAQTNNSPGQTTVTRRPQTPTTKRPATRAPTTSPKPRTTTKKPVSKGSTTRRPITTQRPTTVTTRRPPVRISTSTKKPATRRPTKKVTTTPATVEEDEIIEEDEEGENEEDNEIEENSAGGRKFQCGVRPHVKSGRIVGGKGAAFGEFPWQVLVRESTWLGLFTKNKCGGVLITNKYVITAAHCQPGFLASLVAVFGEFDISGDLESKRSVTKNVKRVIVHRQYDAATFENDLALLELESPIHYDTHIVPICMPSDNFDFTGRMATVTGWGRLKYGGGVPSVLQEVQVPIIENSVCQEMFHTAGHNKKILSSFLCAGYANGQKDSCEGDSGGPLVLQRSDGRWELAGTVSHGIKCAAPYLPGVYMRTTFYKPWLKSITGIK